jgi:hypothetical protein
MKGVFLFLLDLNLGQFEAYFGSAMLKITIKF